LTFAFLGAFLIPYLIFLIGAAVPLFFLEVAIGQFTSSGVSRCWSMFPLMKGKWLRVKRWIIY